MDHFECDDPTFASDTYCLKELALHNVQIRVPDLRSLTTVLRTSGKNLQQLSLKDVHIHDRDALASLCEYIRTSKNLQHLALAGCNLGARCRLDADDENPKGKIGSGLIRVFEALADAK